VFEGITGVGDVDLAIVWASYFRINLNGCMESGPEEMIEDIQECIHDLDPEAFANKNRQKPKHTNAPDNIAVDMLAKMSSST